MHVLSTYYSLQAQPYPIPFLVFLFPSHKINGNEICGRKKGQHTDGVNTNTFSLMSVAVAFFYTDMAVSSISTDFIHQPSCKFNKILRLYYTIFSPTPSYSNYPK